jgi:homoserine dehydrogenase
MPGSQKSSVVLLGLGGVGRAFLELLLRAAPGSAASEIGVLAVVDSATVLKASSDAAEGHLSRAALSAVLLVKQQRTVQATLASVAADPWLKCTAVPRSDAAVVATAAARPRVVVA